MEKNEALIGSFIRKLPKGCMAYIFSTDAPPMIIKFCERHVNAEEKKKEIERLEDVYNNTSPSDEREYYYLEEEIKELQTTGSNLQTVKFVEMDKIGLTNLEITLSTLIRSRKVLAGQIEKYKSKIMQ